MGFFFNVAGNRTPVPRDCYNSTVSISNADNTPVATTRGRVAAGSGRVDFPNIFLLQQEDYY